jgi:hypothetical protein
VIDEMIDEMVIMMMEEFEYQECCTQHCCCNTDVFGMRDINNMFTTRNITDETFIIATIAHDVSQRTMVHSISYLSTYVSIVLIQLRYGR